MLFVPIAAQMPCGSAVESVRGAAASRQIPVTRQNLGEQTPKRIRAMSFHRQASHDLLQSSTPTRVMPQYPLFGGIDCPGNPGSILQRVVLPKVFLKWHFSAADAALLPPEFRPPPLAPQSARLTAKNADRKSTRLNSSHLGI